MARLVPNWSWWVYPGPHVFVAPKQDVDARHKAGHDGYWVMAGLDPAIHLLREDLLLRRWTRGA